MKHELSFVELHNPLFQVGVNLGTKINAKMRNARLIMDDDRQVVWIHFKGKLSAIPMANVSSTDFISIPDDVQEVLGEMVETTPVVPAAIARARAASAVIPVDMPYDPNDEDAAARHREAVRAASANTFKAVPMQNDELLIEQSRAAAMGVKLNRSSQAANAHQVGQVAEEARKAGRPRKIMSHAELNAKLAAEKAQE